MEREPKRHKRGDDEAIPCAVLSHAVDSPSFAAGNRTAPDSETANQNLPAVHGEKSAAPTGTTYEQESEEPSVPQGLASTELTKKLDDIFSIALWSKTASVVEKGLLDLSNLLCGRIGNPDEVAFCQRFVCQEVGLGAIGAAMLQSLRNAQVQVNGCAAICSALTPAPGVVIPNKYDGMVESILLATTYHPQSLSVSRAFCAILPRLFEFKVYTRLFVNGLDGIPILIATMKAYPRDSMIQECACRALCVLSSIDDYKDQILGYKGMEVLGEALRIYRKDASRNAKSIQYYVRHTLSCLSATAEPPAAAKNQDPQATTGNLIPKHLAELFADKNIDTLLSKDLWSKHEGVIEAALATIRDALSSNTKSPKAKSIHQAFFCDNAGLGAIAGVMRRWEGSFGIQVNCCCLIALAFRAQSSQPSKYDGVIESVVAAMKNHKDTAKGFCIALHQLVKYRIYAESFVERLDGIPALVAVMEANSRDAVVQLSACKSLCILSEMDGFKDCIIDCKGMEHLSTALRLHRKGADPTSKDIQRVVPVALARLCQP